MSEKKESFLFEGDIPGRKFLTNLSYRGSLLNRELSRK